MRGSNMLLMVLALVAVATPAIASPALHANRGSAAIGTIQYGSVEGRVTAVNLKAKTVQVAAAEGTTTGPVRVMFTDKTDIHQGILPRTSANITVGEDVDVTYDGSGNKWVADNIDIRNPSVAVAHYLGNGAR
jgi:hypothetical protein